MSLFNIPKYYFSILLLLLASISQIDAQQKVFQFEGAGLNEATQSLLPSYSIHEQSPDNLDLEYDFKGFSVHDIAGEYDANYQLVRIEGFGMTTEPGFPALPVRIEKIVIPDGKEAKVRVGSNDYIEYNDIDIFPAQVIGSDGSQSAFDFAKNEDQYQKDAFFPQEMAGVKDVQVFRGVALAYLRICPVQYNPVQRTLRIYQKLSIEVEFVDLPEKSFGRTAIRPTSDFQLLQNTVINKNAIPVNKVASKSASVLQPKGYLIVTVPEFEAAADSLALWKRQLGYYVEIHSQDSWSVSEVKALTSDIYNNSSYDFEYLLLFGDHQHIPDYYYEDDINGDPWEIYSTNYYACMDGPSDFMPEMAHGRISVRDAAQALLVVNKLIKYEKSPPTDPDFYKKGMHAGYFQDSTRDGTSDYRYARTSIEMYDYMTMIGFDSDLILYAEPDVTPRYFASYFSGLTNVPPQYLRSNGYGWDGNKDDILGALNDGRLYAFHRDHGLIDQWMAPYFHLDHMDDLTNGDELPIVFSVNCGTGKFINPEPYVCFSEKLQRHPNGGAIGIVSATAETKSGFNDGLIIGMMDAIWSDPGIIPDMGMQNPSSPPTPHGPIYTMGDVMIQGLVRMSETWDENGWADRNQYNLYHYFGDPAMQVWTDVPVQMTASHLANLEIGATSIFINNVNAQDAIATICLDDQLLGKVKLHNGSGTIYFPEPLEEDMGEITLTISQHNYIPYIAELEIFEVILPEPDFEADVEEVCSLEEVVFTDMTLNDPNSWEWQITPSTIEFVSSGSTSQNPTIRFLNAGLYSVSLTADNPYGTATITKANYIRVKAFPEAPVVEEKSRCSFEEIPEFSATGENIRWYTDETLSTLLAEGNEYTPDEAPVGLTNCFLTQTIENCESVPAEAELTTYPETPVPSVMGNTVCEYDTAIFTAEGMGVKWYADSLGTQFEGDSEILRYFPMAVGEHILYASSTENDCESQLVPCSVNIKPKPGIPTGEDVEVCSGELVTLEAVGDHIYWYSTDKAANPIFFGNIYEAGNLADGEHKYFISQEVGSCVSDMGEVRATVYSLPVFSLGSDIFIYYSDTLVLESPIEGTYSWFNGSAGKSISFIGSEYGLGKHSCWLEIVSDEGCIASDSVFVSVKRKDEKIDYFDFNGSAFTVFPNPFSDFLNLKFFQSVDQATSIILSDTQGNILKIIELEEIGHDSVIQIDVTHIAEGLYLLTIENEDITHTLRIMKK